jgi:aminoglycoside phosphotransferase (APT) family kinase protein
MLGADPSPSQGALDAVRLIAGPSSAIASVTRLKGGQHADTWRVGTADPPAQVVVRQFPAGDPAGAHEQHALRALAGLGGLAPELLESDLHGLWSPYPTLLISWLDGEADITPTEPEAWAAKLGRALATVHSTSGDRLAALPSVFEHAGATQQALAGPLAMTISTRWSRVTAAAEVLAHSDYWSGNVVWRDDELTGVVDWSGAARGPRGFDVGWCRLDLVLLFDERVADVFLEAYEDGIGNALGDISLWDAWALARSHDSVEAWTPNYAPLGRGDLTQTELRSRHSRWTECVREKG